MYFVTFSPYLEKFYGSLNVSYSAIAPQFHGWLLCDISACRGVAGHGFTLASSSIDGGSVLRYCPRPGGSKRAAKRLPLSIYNWGLGEVYICTDKV